MAIESPAPHPGSAERLHEYWVHGPGAARIRWGAPGDFDRCTRELEVHAHFTPEQAHGYCNLAHHAALGIYPATHAKLEHAGKSRSEPMSERAQMTSASINDLPDSDFAYIEPGGSKDSSGKTVPRSLRHFPVHDAAHVRNALARAPQSPFGEKAMPKIRAAAKKFGVEVADDNTSQASSRTVEYMRSFPLDDVSIKPGDGRTVDAYAAVFNVPTNVRDEDGEYEESIDPGAFNRTLEHARRSGKGIPVLFNHGKTLFGTPSERYSVPIGVSQEVRVDGNGLFTRSRYHKTQAADEILEAIRDGSITGYSFRGDFLRSDPQPPRGGFRRSYNGTLPKVRRTELTLKEFGPGTFVYYSEASITGMRAEQAALLLGSLPAGERERLAYLLSSGTPMDPPGSGTPSDEGPAADDPPHGHSTRSLRDELQDRYAEFIIRHGG